MCNLIASACAHPTHRQSILTLLVCYLFTSSAASAAPAGELDPSFGSNGRLTVHLAGDNEGWIVAQQLDGKLVIGGATLSTDNGFLDYAVVRLMSDGSVDDGFGTAGTTIIDFTGSDDVATSIAVQPDGKILLAGTSEKGTEPFDFDFSLARLNPDGSPDVTFDDDGLVTLDLGGDDDIIFGMILLTSGEIVVAGTTNTNDDYDAVFARFTSTGMLDATFGSGLIAGTVVVDTNGSQDNLFAITRHSDGGLLGCSLSGPTAFNASDASMLAVRLNSNGTVDTTFGTDGIALVADDTATSAAATCVAMPDGSRGRS
jgi:uncharacterized delta-60 repeat protein